LTSNVYQSCRDPDWKYGSNFRRKLAGNELREERMAAESYPPRRRISSDDDRRATEPEGHPCIPPRGLRLFAASAVLRPTACGYLRLRDRLGRKSWEQLDPSDPGRTLQNAKNPGITGLFSVAGAGFEPATFGL